MNLQQITATAIILIITAMEVLCGNNEKFKCGRRLVHHETLITHGDESSEGSWPWHAAIFHIEFNQNIAYKCGGSVISSNAILTAAHCVHENSRPIIPDRILIELGKHNLKISSDNTKQFEVFKIIPHPNYNKTDESNDIAIIRLSTEATFNNYVEPICLWDSNKMDISVVIGKNGHVIGWGITETDKLSYILREATMPVVSLATCLESNRPFFGNFLSNRNFCAGFRNGTSVCNGDSGGSMTFEDNGVFHIRGIVSLTSARGDRNLCNTNEYVVFTDVAKYLQWIKELVPILDSRIEEVVPISDSGQHFETECRLKPGTTIAKGWSCKTRGGRINWQDDGNLVIFDENDKAIWMSNTWTHPIHAPFMWGDRLEFQTDGNLVIYNTDNEPSWASHTKAENETVLIFQEDRNFVMYNGSGKNWTPIWQSRTSAEYHKMKH